MATNHRNEPVNDNNKAKTNADRIFEGSNFGPYRPGEPTDGQYMDAEMYFAEKREYPDGEDGLEYNEDGLPESEPPMVARDENGDALDHSALLPSQHQTGRGRLA